MDLSFLERAERKIAQLTPVSVKRFALNTGVLSITIDDFPRNAWETGGPIFARHDVRATFYVSGGLCDATYLGLPQYSLEILRTVKAAGHELACHTFDHLNSVRSSADAFSASIDRNREFFARCLPDVSLDNFAYPYGDVGFAAKFRTKDRFASCRGVRAGINFGRIETGNLLAVGLESRQIERHDFEKLLTATARERGWLIVFTHDISECPSEFGCRSEALERLIVNAKDLGLDILPVRDALDRASRGWRA